jgi:hypothetical protein
MAGITMDTIVSVTKDQMSCGLDDEAVILSLKKGIYYSLNPCGNRIWSLIQKPVRVGTIRDALLDEFDVDRQTCEADLISLLGDLKTEGLIAVADSSPS